MFYIIYKTTNLINGKFYIGKHKTKNIDDGYMGSGKLLKRAIKKYGVENFNTEVIHNCKSEKEMNLLEKILVVPDAEINYNLCPGGHGGFGYINDRAMNTAGVKKGGRNSRIVIERLRLEDSEYAKKFSFALSDGQRRRHAEGKGFIPDTSGYKHTEESKLKMSTNNSSVRNSQFGTCWITNGKENKKIRKEEIEIFATLGYSKGRVTCH